MNLLIINLDKAIFSDYSSSLDRLKEYCLLVDKIFVIVWTKEKFSPIVYENKLFIYPTNSRSRLFYFFDTLVIVRSLFKQNKINLLLTQDPFETGLIGWLIAKFYQIKLQLQIHTDIFSPFFKKESLVNQLRVFLAKRLIKQADSLRVVSQRIKFSLIEFGILAEKIFVLPIFTDINKFIQPAGFDLKNKYPQFNKIILMASRLSREKNIGLAIGAMAEVIKYYPRAGLIVIGSGAEKNNLISLGRRVIGDNFILEQWSNNLTAYYKGADVFLLTSNYEGWSMAVVEALASGCPVVMTDVGCAGELVRHGKNGLVAPVGDKMSLTNAIIKLLADAKLSQSLKNAGPESVSKLLTKKNYLNQYKKSWEMAVFIKNNV